jgi:hypothetical protein
VEKEECLGIVPTTPACQAKETETGKFKAPILESTGKGDTLLSMVASVLKMPLPVGLRTEETERRNAHISVAFPLADPKRFIKVLIRCLQVPTRLLYVPKAGKTPRQDVLVAGLVGEVHRLLRILFLQEQVLIRHFHVMSIRKLIETPPFLSRMPCLACEVTHLLKICRSSVAERYDSFTQAVSV